MQYGLALGERGSLPRDASVLDLFCGIGGLAFGFTREGFQITGVDSRPTAGAVFSQNGIGDFHRADLAKESVIGRYDLIVGGPPCRPWSAVNLHRRGVAHDDHLLLARFFDHVVGMQPAAMLMENVPPVGRDPLYLEQLRRLERRGYSIAREVTRYSDWGAPTARRRLITVGIRDSASYSAQEFFQELGRYRKPAATVGEAISWLLDSERGAVPDHDWSQLRTIDRYKEKYDSGQFGWSRLAMGEPAPSFGSVDKTYTLHPTAHPTRVLSVREVLSIMGFDPEFRFPEGTSRTTKYRMVANTVSPVFSVACARALRVLLG